MMLHCLNDITFIDDYIIIPDVLIITQERAPQKRLFLVKVEAVSVCVCVSRRESAININEDLLKNSR